jgi:CHAT domain-containing protein/Tfp pilus assembly protein PilF
MGARLWALGLAAVVAGMLAAPTVLGAAEDPAETSMERGLEAFRRGNLEQAVSSWTEANRLYAAQRSADGQIRALTRLSSAQAGLGQYRQAATALETALDLANRSGDAKRIASVRAALGNVYIAVGPPDTAEGHLRSALAAARQQQDPGLVATILNNLGNLLVVQQKPAEAVAAYRESIALATGEQHRVLRARGRVNVAAALRQTAPGDAKQLLDEAFDDLKAATPSHEMAFALVSLGLAYRDLAPALPAMRDALILQSGTALNAAGTAAETIGDRRTASYAWGYLGGLYETERRYSEALDLTRKAVFAAQQANAPESLYRWQWQGGRLLRQLGSGDDAIAAYRRAVTTLQAIRPELSVAYGSAPTSSFRDSLGPLYFELVDLLLRRASTLQRREEIAPYLTEARETVELFKVAELRDFFRDDCVDTALSKVTKLDVVSQTAVVIYPILLPDRTELLLSLPGGLRSVVVPVGLEAMTNEVRQFRRKLEKRTTREYLPHARKLYDWLIRPLEADLAAAGVDTLVFVPDGPLRTIPMAALHDGKQFLVAKYATAITPGLNLTDPRPIQREKVKVLAVGVTEAVQGFAPLPSVAGELEALRTLFNTTTLLNEQFVIANLEKELREQQFTILHVASHGQFENDPAKTFLLAFDGKVTMDRLDQFIGLLKFRDEPLELLTLSACDSAEGDDRAALGLAGIAIKAGARSAVATFWQVHDEVAAELVTEFYRGLRDPAISRASALRKAQQKILTDPRFEHPGFWAPFLMINSWL